VIAAGELCLDLQQRHQLALERRGTAPSQLEEIGIPLVRHDAGPGSEVGRQDQKSELVGAEENDVAGELGEFVAQLSAPEEDAGLELTSTILHRGHVVLDVAKSERAGSYFAFQREWDAVARGTAQWRAIDLSPE